MFSEKIEDFHSWNELLYPLLIRKQTYSQLFIVKSIKV